MRRLPAPSAPGQPPPSAGPSEHPQRPERVPAARLAYRLAELEGERLVVRSIEEPAAIGLPPALDELQGVVHAWVGLDAGGPEVVERAEDVVVVARRERELSGTPDSRPRRSTDVGRARARADIPRLAAGAVICAEPTARSYSSSPSSTQIVVWNDDAVLFGASQFQPPSSSCSLSRRSARLSVGWPKYAPIASTPPLMQGSTSPSKKGLAAELLVPPEACFEARRPPTRRRVGAVGARSAQQLSGEERRQPVGCVRTMPCAVCSLAREDRGTEPFVRDARAFRGDRLRRRVREIAHGLPADRGIGIEQPVDRIHDRIITARKADASPP